MIIHSIPEAIGNTPLLKLNSQKWGLAHTDMYVKLEYLNPFGSIKDRTARGLLQDASFKDMGKYGKRLIESSSGNTAVALQMFASPHNIRLESISNRVRVTEQYQLIQYLGIDMTLLPGATECPDPTMKGNPLDVIDERLRDSPDSYVHTAQYENPRNSEAHRDTTARELFDDLERIDMIVVGAGTGGTGGGIRDYLRAIDSPTKMIGVASHPSDFLPGIRTSSELAETMLYDPQDYDELHEVTSLDALTALRELVTKEAVMAGPTTGANFHAALAYARANDSLAEDGSRRTIVFIACDRLQGYMSYIADRQPDLFGVRRNTDIIERTAVAGDDIYIDADIDALSGRTVIDIRSIASYKAFHIPGSISYPEEVLRELLLHDTPFDGSVVVVCPIGEKSVHFATVLRNRGIDAYSIKGGLAAWRKHKQPLVRA